MACRRAGGIRRLEGRGDHPALAVARGILERCPSLYALVRDDDGRPAAVGRLGVPPGGEGIRGGLYCMATRPDARPRGYAARILQALLREGDARGPRSYWLLVMASNAGARELYARAWPISGSGAMLPCRVLA